MKRIIPLAGLLSLLANSAWAVGPTYREPVQAPVSLAAPIAPALTPAAPQGDWWGDVPGP